MRQHRAARSRLAERADLNPSDGSIVASFGISCFMEIAPDSGARGKAMRRPRHGDWKTALHSGDEACYTGPARGARRLFRTFRDFDAGWSSPVARQAHNLKVAGSNPAPATKKTPSAQAVGGVSRLGVAMWLSGWSGLAQGDRIIRHQACSHLSRASALGSPPAWTTLPSMTMPGVEAMPNLAISA